MFAKGRNEVQVYIDESAIVLERLLVDVPQLIKDEFAQFDNDIDRQVEGLDQEEAYSARQYFQNAYRVEDEPDMQNSFLEAMIAMVFSYCERSLTRMLPTNKKPTQKHGESKMEATYREIITAYNLGGLDEISKYWPNVDVFRQQRNNLIHGDNATRFTVEYVKQNLQCAHGWLRKVADEIAALPKP